MRTDIHKPSSIIPENYDFVTIRCREDEELGGAADNIQMFLRHREITQGKFASHSHGGDCHVCGAWFIDYAIYHHVPSNEYIRVGLTCSEKIEYGHEDEFRRIAQLRRAKQKQDSKIQKASDTLEELGILDVAEALFHDIGGVLRGWDPEEDGPSIKEIVGFDPDCPEYGLGYLSKNYYTFVDMVRNLVKYGWTEKQEEYATKLATVLRDAPYTIQSKIKEHQEIPTIENGKQEIVGQVLSLKWVESFRGDMTHKMLVKNDLNQKFWLTVPKSISEDVGLGDSVSFTATVEVSDKDHIFGFAKRPSKAKIIVE